MGFRKAPQVAVFLRYGPFRGEVLGSFLAANVALTQAIRCFGEAVILAFRGR